MKILRAIFEIYNESVGQFAHAVLFIKEEEFNVDNVCRIVREIGNIVCSDIKVDQLIAIKCLEGPPEIIAAYNSTVDKGYHLERFSSVGKLSLNPFLVPRFSESDFESIIIKLGGRKIPEDVVKTPDFGIGTFVLELKDLQTESLLSKDRQLAIAKLCKGVVGRTVDLQRIFIDDSLSTGYRKLIANTIKNHVKKASEQVKSYASRTHMEAAGVIILNTGMFSLDHEVLKSIVEDILKNNTKTISFALLFTQKMQSNGLDTYANYACEFVGNTPKQILPLCDEVNCLVESKMKQMITDPMSIAGTVESMRPISFVIDGKLFFWNPGHVSGELTSAFESGKQSK